MIIGFEGHSFTGKTTIVQTLGEQPGVSAISETDKYAGGTNNYPPFPAVNDQMAITNVNFFAGLEQQRKLDADLAEGIVVVDRTFLSVALFQKFIRDLRKPGWADSVDYAKDLYHGLIDEDKVIIPDAMCVVTCDSDEEYQSRTNREVSVEELREVAAYRFFTEEYTRLLEDYRALGRLSIVVNKNGDSPEALGNQALRDLDLAPLDDETKKRLGHDMIDRL